MKMKRKKSRKLPGYADRVCTHCGRKSYNVHYEDKCLKCGIYGFVKRGENVYGPIGKMW